MIQLKMDRLEDVDRRLLLFASVQGQHFDSAVVAKALDLDAADVEERLAALDRVHAFVQLLGEHEFPDSTLSSRYAFVHSLYQNALYEAVTPTRRLSWSAAVAETLLEYYGERSEQIAAELALLYEAARDFDRAAEYFVAAAQNAFAVAANHEASDLARRALSNAGKLKDISRQKRIYQAATVLAHIYDTQTRMNEAADAYRIAAKAAIETNDPAAQVQAMCGAAMALFYGKRIEECRQEYEGACKIASEHNLHNLLAAANAVRGAERLCAGDFDASHQSYESAIAVLRSTSLNAGSLAAMNFRGGLHAWRLEHGEAKEILDWTMQSARELGVRGRVLQNLFFQSISLGHQGRIGEALQNMQEARRVAELNGERFVLARLPNTVGWLHHEMCDLERALEFDLEGVKLSQQVNDNEAEISSRINAGHVHVLMGEAERAFEHLQSAEAILDRFTWFTWLFRTRLEAEFATYWMARGDLRNANDHVAKSLALSTRSGLRKYKAWGLSLRAGIAALDDRIDDARTDYDAALGVLADHPAPPTEWQIRKAYGEFLRRVGEPEAGDDQMKRARSLVNVIAESVSEERLRSVLLKSRAVTEL
jgi:tetratricopeptide (TPR) repeat protein